MNVNSALGTLLGALIFLVVGALWLAPVALSAIVLSKAGRSPWWSLFALLSSVGVLVPLAVLAFGQWPAAKGLTTEAKESPAS